MAVIIMHDRASKCTWQRDCQAHRCVDVIKVYNPVRQAKVSTLEMVSSQLFNKTQRGLMQYGTVHAI
jgi:hypothetical protein